MASRSRATGGVHGRIRQTASTVYDENQSLLAELRKGLSLLKDIAVELERENQSQKVKELEDAALELLQAYEDCRCFSAVVTTVGDRYQPGPELTDFSKLFNEEMAKQKAKSSFVPQNDMLLRQFRQAIWDVHHHGEPMPGDEQEDILMTSTQGNILNVKCPVSGKPVTELSAPVRGMECKHIYEHEAILHYIQQKGGNAECPITGCPKVLRQDKVVCDPLLVFDIEELRSISRQHAGTEIIEDFTNDEEMDE